VTVARPRATQADRRARTRSALLESAARGLSRHGYANLVLEQVASEAGYSRGALYHLFSGKEDLALAVVSWVEDTWYAEMGDLVVDFDDPVGALVAVARRHAVYCRRDIARVMMTLRVEFSSTDHPVGRAVHDAVDRVLANCTALVAAGQATGAIPADVPADVVARGLVGAIEGAVIALSGDAPFDEHLAERVVRGALGVSP
jgi:AcrR family transcriptional regulator